MEHCGCTSLQTIVTDHGKEVRLQQLAQLFRPKAYQSLSLPSLSPTSPLHQHPLYRYFCSILQQWNVTMQQTRLPLFSDTEYHRLLFIHDRLKNTAGRSPDSADRILRQLEEWHSRDRREDIKYFPKKPQEVGRSDEQWQLRKTFRSNLPAEIGGYRRKVYNVGPEGRKATVRLLPIERWRKVKTEAYYEVDMEQIVSSQRLLKVQNNRTRTERERAEFSSMERVWKLKKSREEEIGVKSYYDGQFTTGKRMNIRFHRNKKVDGLGLAKRARSSFDLSKGISTPTISNLSQKDINVSSACVILENSKYNIQEKGFGSKFKLTSQKQNGTTVQQIDGMRLMVNPFETSLKKKKRNT